MNENSIVEVLKNVKKEENFSFARNTTYGCGGNAEIAYFPRNITQATAVYSYLVSEDKKFVVIGNGSDVLASDKNYDGAVISTKYLKGIRRISNNSVFCLAGTSVGQLMNYCINNSLSGLEYLAGIPATCGGLAYMNAGASGKSVSEDIVNVKFFDGAIHNFSNKYCNFGYKYSIMRDINGLILGVEFKTTAESGIKVRENVLKVLSKRKHQPKGKSCGCVFKNFNGISAGQIIDSAGLKGLTLGCATVSSEHANFIINSGNRSSEVYALINEVKKKVFERTGILLEEEVVYIGDF